MEFTGVPGVYVRDGKLFPESRDSEEAKFWKYFAALNVIGGGTSSWVVSARRHIDQYDVTVKILHGTNYPQIEVRANVMTSREAYALSKLREVNGVIKMLWCVSSPERVLLVLERPAYSMTVGDYLTQHGSLKEDQARHFMRQIIGTVSVMLNKGVLPCDLRVENVLINMENFDVKLIDLSLAAFIQKPGESYMASPEIKNYAPPETNTKMRFDPHQGTVWLLGIMLYKMLTGTIPSSCMRGLYADNETFTFPPLISCHCKELLVQSLERNPKSRIAFCEVFYHPWLTKLPPVPWQELQFQEGGLPTECIELGGPQIFHI